VLGSGYIAADILNELSG